jgi:outer membrane lipoprotein-sorting protein
MKHISLIVAGLWLSTLGAATARDAAGILSKASAAYTQSNGITASFSLHTRAEMQQVSESLEGVIQMRDSKFSLSTPEVKTWYDGTTQWTYLEHTQEVNISKPEGSELQLTNPAILLASYQTDYTATYKGEATAANGKAVHVIELSPKKKTDILRIELQIDKRTNLPARIRVESKNNIHTTIQINNIKTNVNQPEHLFSFPQADYPQAEIIDLR